METLLSQRLLQAADWVPQGARLLDVGSDHAYLPIALMETGKIDFAVAGEVVAGPYQAAQKNVASKGLDEYIKVRLANGLAAMEQADAINCITICGMGGRLIADILAAGQDKLAGVSYLILQPNNREDDLRTYLAGAGFAIEQETILYEKGKYYEVILAKPGQMSLDGRELRFGPYLRQEKSQVFCDKWAAEARKLEKALTQIPENHQQERQALEDKIQAIKEEINEG